MYQAKSSSMILHHIADKDNIMADIISHAFKMGNLFAVSNDLVSYFNTRFYLMQNESWQECQVPSDLISCVTDYLRGKLPTMASLLRQTKTGRNNGFIGKNMIPQLKPTPSLIPTYPPLNVTLSQEHLLIGSGRGSTEE